ncbi:MAG: hypothetical protein ABH874_02580 [Methanobacteriota archaeon]|jgi:hypothetical protein
MKKKGYSYSCSTASIKEYASLAPEMKLEWLEEANRFIWKFSKNKEIIEKFRRGEI